MMNDVLPPWTPLKIDSSGGGVSVSAWGRQYDFDALPFPSGIESAGSALLASPAGIHLRVKGDDKDTVWENCVIRTEEERAEQLVFTCGAESPYLVLTARTVVEYDGLIRVDWSIGPRRHVVVEALTVDIPLREKHATLHYYCPRRDREGPGTGGGTGGEIPSNGLAVGFCPYIWIGDEERGLAWFCESDKGWHHAGGGNHGVEIIRSSDSIVLRINLISVPFILEPGEQGSCEAAIPEGTLSSLHYIFGLQATPVRPIEKDAWDTRIFHVNQELPEFSQVRLRIPEQLLDDMARAGVKTVCIHEHWTDIEGYFVTDYGEDLKQLVTNCHERDMQILLYFGFLISDLAPEWPTIGAECVVHPDDKGCYVPFDYPPQPVQNAYCVCYNSRWQDVTVAGIAGVIEQYGIDGLYFDGTTTPWGCRNPAHGCGYERGDGTRGYTYPFFAVREMMKKLYALVMRNNPDGQVNVHSSYYLTVPTIAWTTGYTDGEQFAWDEVEQTLVGDDDTGIQTTASHTGIPLDRFRCEFMGHPLGVPADFLADIRGPFGFSGACSFALLHDVPVRIWMRFEYEQERRLWETRDNFGCKEAEWFPYWRNSSYVKVAPAGAFCSFHRHPANGVLAVISNLTGTEQTVEVTFCLEKLDLGGDTTTVDALTGAALETDHGLVQLVLPSQGWKIVRIESSLD